MKILNFRLDEISNTKKSPGDKKIKDLAKERAKNKLKKQQKLAEKKIQEELDKQKAVLKVEADKKAAALKLEAEKKGRGYKGRGQRSIDRSDQIKTRGETQRSQKERWKLKKGCIDLNVLGTCRISIIF